MEQFHDKTPEQSASLLSTDLEKGLTNAEVQQRLAQYGPNQLEGAKEKSVLAMILDQLKDFLVLILMVAAVVSILLGERLEGIVILAIVVLNTFLGVYQEKKASNALKALQEMASPTAKVLRSGTVCEVASAQIVPGDVVILDAGDYVPADLRLTETMNLKIDEAALTGESVPVEKDAQASVASDAGIGDQLTAAFMSTVVTYGRGRGVVTHTGMKTQMGSIANMLNVAEEESTPLQKKLDALGKLLGIVCLAIVGIIFLMGVLRGEELFEIFMTSVSLAVAAIPEGLTVVVTVVLALGMQRMVKVNAITKKLSAVETLGSTTVICSDKTGTLTQNKMTVQKIFFDGQIYDVTGTGYSPIGEVLDSSGQNQKERLQPMLRNLMLCSDARYTPQDEYIIGDPTEGALVVLAHKAGLMQDAIESAHPRLQEIPFDSGRKLMSTFHKIGEQTVMVTKGAPDELLRRCTQIELGGAIIALTEEMRAQIHRANEAFGTNALRVIGTAYKPVTEIDNSFAAEQDLIFHGLVGMIDPPREEARDAIALCKEAGIAVKMITGDHQITAKAIAVQLGITDPDGAAVEGRRIEEMTQDELEECVRTTHVFSRVSPEHKVRLVDAVRANGHIVAMTGDGVNDAPSLKHADIGVAMGITGTDVSKEAADMILTDDNFASIVNAVSEGRTIYANIRKVVGFLLSCNIGEILVIFIAMLMRLPVPLVAIQLLAINLITDAFPAFALGMEKAEPGVMQKQPRDPQEPIVDKKMAIAVTFQSLALAAGTLASFLYGYYVHNDLEVARTCAFLTLILGELLRAYSARSEHISVFKMKLLENSYLNRAVFASVVFLFATIYVPILNPVFSTVPLTLDEMLMALLLSVLPVLGGELAKKIND